MAVEGHITQFELLFVFVLVDEGGLQFAFVAEVELLDFYLLGEIDAVDRHSLVYGLLRAPVDRKLLVLLLLVVIQVVDLIFGERLLLNGGEIPVEGFYVYAEIVFVVGDYGDVLLGVGDAYVGDAILKIRLAVVVPTQSDG